MKRHRLTLAITLVLAAGLATAAQSSSPSSPARNQAKAAATANGAAQQRGEGADARRGPVSNCLPEDAGGLAMGQPDYAETRRELAERARKGATAQERADASAMLARIDADEARAAKAGAPGRCR